MTIEDALLETLAAVPRGLAVPDLLRALWIRFPAISLDEVARAAERLRRERRLAALLHVYGHPDRIGCVRGHWLDALAAGAAALDGHPGGAEARKRLARRIAGWDGWTLPA